MGSYTAMGGDEKNVAEQKNYEYAPRDKPLCEIFDPYDTRKYRPVH
jgi:hypothetical protein